jgi:dynein heavy chain 2
MKSSAGEYVKLDNPVKITDDVENWLGDLSNEMKNSLANLLKKSLKEPNLDIMNMPSQVCCITEMVQFCNNCVSAINKGKIPNYKQDLHKTLEQYTSFDHGGDMLLLSKLKALILDVIHNVEIVDTLIKNNVQSVTDWFWHKQLRYGMGKNGFCKIMMVDAIFDYTYEY